ncbi:MAG: hypothetical protein Q9N68_09865 [Gammaproteobacteria bacterium]|nr:hypothetical protein [Gammaproteobacteria bacterium]
MQSQIEVNGRQVQVEVSRRADKLLQQRTTPLRVEMELHFGCMVRKQVTFHEQATAEYLPELSGNLKVDFRPLINKVCSVGAASSSETAVPMEHPEAFVPHWLKIDYHHGQWQGEFGYQK